MTKTYRLHWVPDNASLVIRLALEEMGVPYEPVLLDRVAGAHKAAAYLKLNPAGLIPALETPDGPIFETAAILLWLADRHGKMAPAPEHPDRGAFLKYLFFTSNTLHVAARMRFYPNQYLGADPSPHATLRTHLQGEIRRHLDLLEGAYAKGEGGLGEALSIVDVYVACICRWVMLYPTGEAKDWCQISQWPHLHAMAQRLEACDCTRAAVSAEGLGPTPFTNPVHPTPPEGRVM
ncbi:MAG: glutathione S-transferase family protein [Pseudomonadota bacterium]